MTYVIAGPFIGVKDTACVDTCPVRLHPPQKERDLRRWPPGLRRCSTALHRSYRVHPITLPRRQISAISRTSKSY